MGSFGKRNNHNSRVSEPPLLKDTDNILKEARDGGYYIGKSLDIHKFIKDKFPDIEIKEDEMPDAVSGSLNYVHPKWIISVNKNHLPKRKKFTIAHELGHYLLHKDINTKFSDSVFFRNSQLSPIEYAANEFAATLLMPEEDLRELIDVDNIKSIGTLANIFDVSARALLNRILKLGYRTKNNG